LDLRTVSRLKLLANKQHRGTQCRF
jgi:hypothetical protein